MQLSRYSCATAELVVRVNLKNQEQLLSRRTAPDHHFVSLIIGDSDNNVVFLQKLTWGNEMRVPGFQQTCLVFTSSVFHYKSQNCLNISSKSSCSSPPLFFRDLVLLKSGSWSKKIEVKKASAGEEISFHLISSEYGKALNHGNIINLLQLQSCTFTDKQFFTIF